MSGAMNGLAGAAESSPGSGEGLNSELELEVGIPAERRSDLPACFSAEVRVQFAERAFVREKGWEGRRYSHVLASAWKAALRGGVGTPCPGRAWPVSRLRKPQLSPAGGDLDERFASIPPDPEGGARRPRDLLPVDARPDENLRRIAGKVGNAPVVSALQGVQTFRESELHGDGGPADQEELEFVGSVREGRPRKGDLLPGMVRPVARAYGNSSNRAGRQHAAWPPGEGRGQKDEQ